MPATILVVEDEPAIQSLIEINLRRAGHDVALAGDAETARRLITATLPDLVLLDWMLPGMSGIDFARQLRRDARTRDLPVIMLTARADERDKIEGFDIGADDYITKPFNAREVVARVRALLRRSQFGQSQNSLSSILTAGRLRLDLDQHSVTVDGAVVELTRTEFKLLHLLMANPGHTLTRDELLEKVMGYAYEGMGRTLDTHIRNLRKKIEPDADQPLYIQTVYGVGYRLVRG